MSEVLPLSVVRVSRHLRRSGCSFWTRVAVFGCLLGCVTLGNAQQSESTTTGVGKLTGRVLNAATGLPVPRALVRFNDRAVLADHEGKFEFDQLSEIQGSLEVIKPGFSMSRDPSDGSNLSVQLSQLSGPLDVRLYPEALLTGTISSADGEPLARISVQARRSVYDESGHHWNTVAGAQTDTHGQFRLPVPAGDYQLQTRYVDHDSERSEAILPLSIPAQDGQDTAQTIHLRSGEERQFDLHPLLRRTFSVTMMVQSDGGRAFPTITAQASDGTTLSLRPIPTPVPGQLRVGLPSGSYTLSARLATPEEAQIAETNVTVADHDVSGVVLHFVQIPAIPVELAVDSAATSDNVPPNLARFGILLQSTDPNGEVGYPGVQLITRHDAPSILNAPPGSYRLQANYANEWFIKSATYGASDLLSQNLVIANGSSAVPIRLLVSNQTGSLRGSTMLDGNPVSAWLYLVSGSPSATPVLTLRSSDGKVTRPNLPPGSYQAIAFEHRHSADFTNPATIARYSTWVQSVIITAGNESTLNLAVVPESELQP